MGITESVPFLLFVLFVKFDHPGTASLGGGISKPTSPPLGSTSAAEMLVSIVCCSDGSWNDVQGVPEGVCNVELSGQG